MPPVVISALLRMHVCNSQHCYCVVKIDKAQISDTAILDDTAMKNVRFYESALDHNGVMVKYISNAT